MAGFAGLSGMGRIDFDDEEVIRALSFTGLEIVTRHVSPYSSWVAVTHEGEARRQAPVYHDSGTALLLHGYITGIEGRAEFPNGDVLALCAGLYLEEGPFFARRLNGAFVLVIEDLASGRVHLISDRLGTCNVYFHLASGFFSFATRLEAIRCVNPSIADRVNESALATFLTLGRILEGSMLEAVRRLDSACVLTYDGAVLTEERYWKPFFLYSDNPLGYEDNARRLVQAMGEAVLDCVRGLDKVGLFLSGGLDSRMVLFFLGGRDVTSYTACDRRNLETRVAEKAARRAGAAHVMLLRKTSHYLDIVPQAVRICEGSYEYDHAHLEGLWRELGEREDRVFLSGFGMNSILRTICLSKLDAPFRMRSGYDRVIESFDSVEAVEGRLIKLLGSEQDALAVMAPALQRDAAGYPR